MAGAKWLLKLGKWAGVLSLKDIARDIKSSIDPNSSSVLTASLALDVAGSFLFGSRYKNPQQIETLEQLLKESQTRMALAQRSGISTQGILQNLEAARSNVAEARELYQDTIEKFRQLLAGGTVDVKYFDTVRTRPFPPHHWLGEEFYTLIQTDTIKIISNGSPIETVPSISASSLREALAKQFPPKTIFLAYSEANQSSANGAVVPSKPLTRLRRTILDAAESAFADKTQISLLTATEIHDAVVSAMNLPKKAKEPDRGTVRSTLKNAGWPWPVKTNGKLGIPE